MNNFNLKTSMSINQITFLLLSVFLLNSCKKDTVRFKEPQPQNIMEQSVFSSFWQGHYYDYTNDVELSIEPFCIIKKSIVSDTVSFKEIEKEYLIKGDSLINKSTQEKFKFIPLNDTIISGFVFTDTIFNLKKKDKLKKFKGHYFLNKPIGQSDDWEVLKLSLHKGVLKMNAIFTQYEIDLLEDITNTVKDSSHPFIVNPTKKQFKEFIKKNGFTEGETFVRI